LVSLQGAYTFHLATFHSQAQELPEPPEQYPPIHWFIMKMESDDHLPYLDIDIYRRPDGSIGHKLHHK
jgi:hypothetical protein